MEQEKGVFVKSQDPSLRDLAILVVEDEYYIADDLRKHLVALGAAVVGPVPTVKAAREQLNSAARIDLCILDINLDGEFGYVLADELEDKKIPFLFATGYDPVNMPERYRKSPRLDKPFDQSILSRVIRETAGGAAV